MIELLYLILGILTGYFYIPKVVEWIKLYLNQRKFLRDTNYLRGTHESGYSLGGDWLEWDGNGYVINPDVPRRQR